VTDQTTIPFAARYGLVRPRQGRYVAGACAAIGRATRTDPVLWRVLLAVLICFAGIGAVIYLALWLVTPAEGDTASPIEALFGRGRSGTSPVVAVLLGLVAAALLVFITPRPMYVLILGTAVILTVVLLVNRSTSTRPPEPAPAPEPPVPPVPQPVPQPVPPVPADAMSVAPTTGAGYRPPFAPHGPFAVPPAPRPPRPPPAPRERSSLPSFIFFAGLVVLGGLGLQDFAGVVEVNAAGYLAAALAVVGAGLVVGAWLGRARVMIALGAVLALGLGMSSALAARPDHPVATEIFWAPASAAELEDHYELSLGDGQLDLTQIDFTGRHEEVAVRVTLGEIRVYLPEDLAVTVNAQVASGSTTVFGEEIGGMSADRTVVSRGRSGDGGTLALDLSVRLGHIAVTRGEPPR
jgi:phage shock protein PspC (stress-responsive transcriptional regulator)